MSRNWQVAHRTVKNVDRILMGLIVMMFVALITAIVIMGRAPVDSPEREMLRELREIRVQLYQTCVMVSIAVEESAENCETPPHLRSN